MASVTQVHHKAFLLQFKQITQHIRDACLLDLSSTSDLMYNLYNHSFPATHFRPVTKGQCKSNSSGHDSQLTESTGI